MRGMPLLPLRYGSIALALLLATLLRLLLDPYLGNFAPFPVYFGAVLFVAWYAGALPAMATLLGGALLASHLFLSPSGSVLTVTDAARWTTIGLFLFVGLSIIVLVTLLRVSRGRAYEAEQRFRRLADNAADLIYRMALPSGRYEYLSPAATAVFGYTPEEFYRRPLLIREVIHPDWLDYFAREWLALIKGDMPPSYEYQIIHKSGEPRWLYQRNVLLRNAQGRPIAIEGIVTDITERKLMEDALRTSEKRAWQHLAEIEATYHSAPIGLCVLDTGLRFVRVNERLAEFNGLSVAEHVGRTLREVVPAIADEAETMAYRIIETGECVLGLELTAETSARPGMERHWIGHWIPLKDANGKVTGISVVVEDMTARQQAESALRESERKYRHLWESLNDAAFIADVETGCLTETNNEGERLLGRTREEILRMHQSELHPPGKAEEYRKRFADHISQGHTADYDGEVIRKDGSIVSVHISAAPITLGSKRLIVGLFHDITERKRVEEVLRLSEAKLREQAEQLAEADRRKDEFLATLAHELRNPLAPISNAFEFIKRCTDNSPVVGNALNIGQRQVRQLIRLVDDLLDISRITRGKITLRKERVALDAILQAAQETSRPHIEAGGHWLVIDAPEEPMYLDADPTRLTQAISNLLINAAKFTETGSPIRLGARVDGNEVAISVQDTGIGIPARQLPRVFDLFAQVEQPRGCAARGLGVGLALVKSLVEMHGGSVQATSPGLGLGSTFTIRLPRRATPSAKNPRDPQPEAGAPTCSRTILVVDDDTDVANSTTMLLQAYGHKVRTVYDGATAIEAALREPPEVILLDIGMPGMNGYDVARKLRDRPELQDTLLVALTGWGQEKDRRRSRRTGFDRHLVKPVNPDTLQDLLLNHTKPGTGTRPHAGSVVDPAGPARQCDG